MAEAERQSQRIVDHASDVLRSAKGQAVSKVAGIADTAAAGAQGAVDTAADKAHEALDTATQKVRQAISPAEMKVPEAQGGDAVLPAEPGGQTPPAG